MTVEVLIVDDQEPFRMAARMVVEATEGFEVVGEAETGEDSVTMASDLMPDLVLMDVNLPGINGLDATRQILADNANSAGRAAPFDVRGGGVRAARGRVRRRRLHPQVGLRTRPSGRGLGGRARRRLILPQEIGTLPLTAVPSPTVLTMSNVPPRASSRSAIPWSPVPCLAEPGSKPTPSSVTANESRPLLRVSDIRTCEASAYLVTFWSASRHEK